MNDFIFDIDGTLVDSNDLHVRAWQEAFAQYGKRVSVRDLQEQMGKGGDQLMPVFLSDEELRRQGKSIHDLRVRLYTQKYLALAKPFPGVVDLFTRLKRDGARVLLASSATEAEVSHHVQALGVSELIDGATSADDAEHSKPSPDIFQAALERLPDRKRRVFVIGDTPYDGLAARKLGLPFVGVLTGGFDEARLREVGAMAVFRDVRHILETLDTGPFGRRPDLAT